MKLTKLEIAVAVAGAVLDVPRFVDIGMQTHGRRIATDEWALVHGVTTGLFGVVMAVSVMMCLASLARPQKRPAYWALMACTSALLVTTGIAVTLTLQQVSGWAFTVCAVAAPLLVIVNVPIAASLRDGPDASEPVRTVTESVHVQRVTVEPAHQTPPAAAVVADMPAVAPQNALQAGIVLDMGQGSTSVLNEAQKPVSAEIAARVKNVAEMRKRNLTNPQIAERLGVSLKTVENAARDARNLGLL